MGNKKPPTGRGLLKDVGNPSIVPAVAWVKHHHRRNPSARIAAAVARCAAACSSAALAL